MNIILKQALHWISIWVFFMLTVFWIVYAATIVNVTTQTINSGDTIWAWWYQDVNDQLSNATEIPTGAVMAFNGTTCPTGWTEADGSWDEKDTSWTNTTLDLRGRFIRWVNPTWVNSGAISNLWDYQDDMLQWHWHEKWAVVFNQASQGWAWLGAEWPTWVPNSLFGSSDAVRTAITDGTNWTPRLWNETRPKNISLLYCVKN